MERICPHGVGHPDPDEYAIASGGDAGVHGCDGCCAPTVEIPKDDYPKLLEFSAESWKDSTFHVPDLRHLSPAIGSVDYLTLKIYTDHGWEETNGDWREASVYPRLYEVIGDTFSSEDHPLGWFKLPDFTARVVVNLPESEYSSFHGRDVEALPWNRHRQLYHTDARFYHTINRLSQGDLTPQQSIEILIDSLAEACGELETIRNVIIDRTLHPWNDPGRIIVEDPSNRKEP
jgi:hypothetical protein